MAREQPNHENGNGKFKNGLGIDSFYLKLCSLIALILIAIIAILVIIISTTKTNKTVDTLTEDNKEQKKQFNTAIDTFNHQARVIDSLLFQLQTSPIDDSTRQNNTK